MAQIMGRLTADAIVKKSKSDKPLVSFYLVENFDYKTKEGEKKSRATFYNCTLWNRMGLAPHLTKGTALILEGQPEAVPYKDKKKKAKASINFTVHRLQFTPSSVRAAKPAPEAEPATSDDLPF
jgi:single-strand DNA-binding protein